MEGSFDNWTTRQNMQRSGKDFTIVKLLPPGVYQVSTLRCLLAPHSFDWDIARSAHVLLRSPWHGGHHSRVLPDAAAALQWLFTALHNTSTPLTSDTWMAASGCPHETPCFSLEGLGLNLGQPVEYYKERDRRYGDLCNTPTFRRCYERLISMCCLPCPAVQVHRGWGVEVRPGPAGHA